MEQPLQQIKNRLERSNRLRFFPGSSCPEHPLAHLGFFLLTRQFFLLFPGVFQFLHPPHFLKSVLQSQVRVRVHRHPDVAMTHQVLQRLRVHACPSLNAAVSVAAYVRRDVWHLFPENLVVALHHVIEPMFPVHRNQRHPVIIQKKESTVAVHHLFNLRSFPLLQDRPKAIANLITHGKLACTGVRFGFFDHVLHTARPLKLMIDVQNLVLQVDVLQGQPAEFRNPQTCVEQDEGDEEPMASTEFATVIADSGSTVNMRTKAKSTAALVERVPLGARVEVLGACGSWTKVKFGSRTGYMMTKFLIAEDDQEPDEDLTLEEHVTRLEKRVTMLEAYDGAVG